jgi:hypothetical protein
MRSIESLLTFNNINNKNSIFVIAISDNADIVLDGVQLSVLMCYSCQLGMLSTTTKFYCCFKGKIGGRELAFLLYFLAVGFLIKVFYFFANFANILYVMGYKVCVSYMAN